MATQTEEQRTSQAQPQQVLRPHRAGSPATSACTTSLIISLPPEGMEALDQLMQQTGNNLTELFQKALALYKVSKDAVDQGKAVGIATSEDSLETQFINI